jgi:DNA-directed RNA polymerase subunit M/transcription elongation factor TFIIS
MNSKFCDSCNFWLFIREGQGDSSSPMEYYCRNCGNVKKIENMDNIVISSITFGKKKKTVDITKYVNAYTKYDPTLPRAPKEIHCPQCNSNENIVMVRYDEINLKYLFICPSDQCVNHVFENVS